jgi:hypothetical protein
VKDHNAQDATKSDIALVLAELSTLRAEVERLRAQMPSAEEPTVQ